MGEWGNGRPVARPTAQSSEENARPFTRPLSHSPTLPLSHSPTLPLRIAFETRLHLFHGDHLAYHREYLALPEHAAVMRDWTPHPEAVRVRAPGPGMVVSVAHAPYGTAAFGAANASARPNEILLGLQGSYDPRWGIWPAADGEELVQLDAAGRETGRVPCKQLKQAFADLHRLYPRYRDGFYNFIMDIHTSAPIYKRHPEWVLKNRNGRESAGVYGTGYVQANWTPAFVADLTAKLLRTMDYYDQDLLYLDFGPGTILVDWERGEVVQLHVYADFLKRLHAELAKRGKLLWLNSFTGQFYYDIGYHESDGAAHQLLGQWRNGAAINLARKLYTRPGTICVPLYWHGGDMFVNQGTANEDRYRNLVLASGLTATGCWLDPYEKHFPAAKGGADWAAVFQYHAPVQFATAELARSQFAEIGLSPAHWRDFDSDYETFTLKMGPAFLLNVISHKKEAGNAAFTVDPKRMGLAPGKPLFNWQFVLRDPKRYPKQAPAPPDWDRLFERSEVRVLDVPAGRLSLVLNDLIPDRVRLTAVTQVPAVLSSVAGKATQLLLPENLGCRLRGAADTAGRVVRLTAEMEQPGEALLWFPEVWGEADLTVGGKPTAAEPVLYGSERFLKVPLPAGKSAVVAQAK